MDFKRATLSAVLPALMAVILAGCASSSPFGPSQRLSGTPQNLPPVQNSSVQSTSLPPLQGQDGMVTTADTFDPNIGDPALTGQQTASADGSFVSLDDLGGGGTTPGGRDLSGSLTPTKLLGAWTVNADLEQCRLNLTQTNKSGTNRFRASAPNCAIPVLALVSSWELAGSQVKLYDESGAIVGALQLSGSHFVGILSGGVSVTMDG
jgi:Protease inhibitor Inh